ncbi:phospholipase D-like domain-containing protein [Erythrobacter sp. CCH5-A1]|jgi:hypothetical protein|uniref:phospholipase D-like domain-containing protein n=1 Tax=Erythrobacter sp. CCH5-A1 TaxID=1768792 RepID=UPI000835298F|nr:phospholipase D-like domain-containing protein [Erythrobacter sp. CCH5-A1]
MAELEEKHLKSIIEKVGKGDDELTHELTEKLSGSHLPAFRRQVYSIISDSSLPLVDDNDDVHPDVAAAAESIIKAIGRPVFIIADNKVTEQFSGPDSSDTQTWVARIAEARERIDRLIPAVGRIEVTNHPDFSWVGTGWLIDSDIIVTNRHVAVEFGRRDNARFVFRTGLNNAPMVSRIDFLEEFQRSAAAEFSLFEILWIAPTDGPDVAFLRVMRQAGQPALARPVVLASTINGDDYVATIGYPARDSRVPDQELVKKLFGDVYDKKRLAPGIILANGEMELEHDCSTLGGNSGSLIMSLQTGEAIALHFAGLFKEANYAVPAPRLKALLADARRGLLDKPPRIDTSPAPLPRVAPAAQFVAAGNATTMRLTVSVPLEISVRIAGDMTSGFAVAAGQTGATPPIADGIDAAVALAVAELAGERDVLDVRRGYRFRGGWITDEEVVVVELREKRSLDSLAADGTRPIPSSYLGIGVDVRTAPLTDQLAALGIEEPFAESRARPGQYREPPNLSLDRVNAPMKAIFHVSPDSGFPNLKAFISRVKSKLTATMYEWEPNHISDAIATAMSGNGKSLKMVTQKKGTKRAIQVMKTRLGTKFKHVWASTGSGGIVPSAYHIKVASRDGEEFWLSSGNWKNSNQADIDPAGEHSTDSAALMHHNREWHAIIAHPELARTFQKFIEWDFDEAKRVSVVEALEVELPDLFVPEVAFFEETRRRPAKYFAPLVLNRSLDIQPLLTPDRDTRGNRLFMVHATKLVRDAEDSVLLQNQSFNMLTENVDEFDTFFAALRDRQKAGLDVRIIFRDGREFGAESGRKQQPLLERLKAFGFDMDRVKLQLRCHTKGIIVDGKTVLFGSHNLTNEGALYNRDASLIVYDPEVARYFAEIFEHDWTNLAQQRAEEVVGGIRIAQPGEPTPPGYRRISGAELAEAL